MKSIYEDVWFFDKITGEKRFAGDHYGDPAHGLISELEGWRISGGEGIMVFDKEGRLWSAFRFQGRDQYAKTIVFETKTDAIWIENAIKETNVPGYVSNLEMAENGEIEIQLDPLDRLSSRWRLDITKMSCAELETLASIAAQDCRGKSSALTE